MARGASREALRTLATLLVAGIACAQVEVFDGAGLGNALGQPSVLSAQQPISTEQQQPVIFQQQQQPLRHQSYGSADPLASFQQQQGQALRHHSFEAEDPFASLQQQHHRSSEAENSLTSLQQPTRSVSLQQQPTVSPQQLQQPASAISLLEQPTLGLQQQPALGISAQQGSASPLYSQAVSLPLQQVPVLATRPSALTVLPIQPSASLLTEPSAQLQQRPEDVLEEEAAMASAAMAQTVMQSLGQALAQPAPHSARAGLQRQRTAADPEGGSILEELAKLVESALLPEGQAPALAPGPATLPAVAGMPSIALPQAFGSQQAQKSSSEGPDEITVVKVQKSLADPDVQRVQVVSLKKVHPESEGTSFQAQAAAPQVHPHLTSAAMRAQAEAAQPLPTAKSFEAVPKSTGHTHEQSFREAKHKAAGQAEQRSFEAEVAKELYRLANAPASEYEEIDAPDLAPAAGERPRQAPAFAPAAAPVQAPHSAPEATALQSNAIKGHTVPGVSFISNRNARRALRAASGATHPAVIWQSHLLDVSPQQWTTLKSSYISGIAQGANVGKDQVIILGVTSGTSVTVNTQIIYYNDDSSAAGELKNALADQQSSPVYIPNFGNVQVSGVTQANVPIATPPPSPSAAATASYVAYTPASFSAPGPGAGAAAAPGQQTAPGQQVVTPVMQAAAAQDAASDSSVAPVIRTQQVYKNNGLPVGAAVGVPLGAVALAAGLLYLAHLNRKRTARLIQEYTEPMIRKDADMSPHGSLASQAAPPPRRNTPSPKVSPRASPKPSPSKV